MRTLREVMGAKALDRSMEQEPRAAGAPASRWRGTAATPVVDASPKCPAAQFPLPWLCRPHEEPQQHTRSLACSPHVPEQTILGRRLLGLIQGTIVGQGTGCMACRMGRGQGMGWDLAGTAGQVPDRRNPVGYSLCLAVGAKAGSSPWLSLPPSLRILYSQPERYLHLCVYSWPRKNVLPADTKKCFQ